MASSSVVCSDAVSCEQASRIQTVIRGFSYLGISSFSIREQRGLNISESVFASSEYTCSIDSLPLLPFVVTLLPALFIHTFLRPRASSSSPAVGFVRTNGKRVGEENQLRIFTSVPSTPTSEKRCIVVLAPLSPEFNLVKSPTCYSFFITIIDAARHN